MIRHQRYHTAASKSAPAVSHLRYGYLCSRNSTQTPCMYKGVNSVLTYVPKVCSRLTGLERVRAWDTWRAPPPSSAGGDTCSPPPPRNIGDVGGKAAAWLPRRWCPPPVGTLLRLSWETGRGSFAGGGGGGSPPAKFRGGGAGAGSKFLAGSGGAAAASPVPAAIKARDSTRGGATGGEEEEGSVPPGEWDQWAALWPGVGGNGPTRILSSGADLSGEACRSCWAWNTKVI